ncbi:MAG: carbohydrate ABC transporter permease [Caldilineales bacterium]|nr:carbohydrate ABC transporter permease [Caldilineales bacterium]MDW8318735.1 carbohydrate ABC transporter permease [Anaerolineae bacterium]
MVASKKLSDRIVDWLIMVFLVALGVSTLLPLVNTLAVSLSNKAAVSAGQVNLWPVGFNLDAYNYIVQDTRFWRAFGVSVQRVLLGGALNFILAVITAFPLSREAKEFPLRNVIMWLFVFGMILNVGLVPWFLTIDNYGLLDTIWALVLPGAVPIWNVIILMNYFRGIPKELDEAARIDGANPWQVLWHIYLPTSLPALATITLFSIVGHWNSFFDGLILMNNPDNYPLQTYIQQLVIAERSVLHGGQAQLMAKLSNATLNAAKLFVAMIPILLIYPFLQRYFIRGITLGSVKE